MSDISTVKPGDVYQFLFSESANKDPFALAYHIFDNETLNDNGPEFGTNQRKIFDTDEFMILQVVPNEDAYLFHVYVFNKRSPVIGWVFLTKDDITDIDKHWKKRL